MNTQSSDVPRTGRMSRLLLGTMAALFCYGGSTNLPALLLLVVLAWIATSLLRPL
jgi:hypothetical protein